MKFDESTINKDELNKLPIYESTPSRHLQEDPGNGCFLDAPGYPTYFTRSVYTQRGDTPENGAQMVILGHVIEHSDDWKGVKGWEEYSKIRDQKLRRLWNPLPLNHPRVRAWKIAMYNHLKHCYYDAEAKESDKTLIYPVPDYKLKSFIDDPRFSEEWKAKEKAAIEQMNKEIIEHAKKIAIPENHQAVRSIRKFYPEYEPELDLIENPPRSEGNWYERLAERPTPENCPGEHGHKHPVNGTWCQMCGWHAETTE